jgi:nucleoside phosphorylase
MKPGSKSGVDILIVTALAEEQEVLRQYFKAAQEIHSSNAALTYHVRNIRTLKDGVSYTVAITCLFVMGNPDSGIQTVAAIRELDPACVVMFGLAAGIRGRVNLGDVIVSTQIFYYEQAKVHPGRIEIRPISFQVDPYLKNGLANFASQSTKTYRIKFGPFAVGEKVIADSTTEASLREYEPNLLGIEMESYGVASAAGSAPNRPRFIAIRGVSDHADEQKDDVNRLQALNNAADFLHGFLMTGALPIFDAPISKERKTFIAIHHVSLDRRSSLQSSMIDNFSELEDYSIRLLEIDQTDLYKRGSLIDPFSAFERQRGFDKTLNELLEKYPGARIGYFALAHIPLIFHLGYEANIREVQVFSSHRQTRHWEALSDEDASWPEISAENMPTRVDKDVKEIVIRISISYPVHLEQIENAIDIRSMPVLDIKVEEPKPDLVKYEDQLNSYAQVFYRILAESRRFFPNTKNVHIFYSGPPTLAFRCAQQISKTVDPDVIVYNFSNKDTPNYGWAVNIHRGEIIDLRETT